MVLGLSLRVSWICLLLFSSGACFPATQGVDKYGSNLQSEGSSHPLHLSSGSPVTYDAHIPIVPYSGADYGYPYTAPVASGGGSAPGSSNLHSGGSSRPLHLSSGSPVTYDSHIPIVPYSGVGSRPMNGAASGFVYPSGNAGHASRNTAAGDHDIPFPYGSRHMNGAASGFAYPTGNAGQPSRNTASGYNALPYRSAVSGSSHPWDPRHDGAVASSGFATDGAASDLNAWIEARPFIDLSFLESAQGMPLSGSQKTSPPMPSSYIIQSRNGYIRDREAFSHKTFSPEYPEPPVMMSKSVSAPGIVSKGGKKV